MKILMLSPIDHHHIQRILLTIFELVYDIFCEVLKIKPIDIQDRKITLSDPKSGKESETELYNSGYSALFTEAQREAPCAMGHANSQ